MLLHHERKAANGAKRVQSLDDVYGSIWLTSGLGSVIVLECEPGDPTAELRHLKQPAEPVGPLTLRHDHAAGVTALFDDPPDLLNFSSWVKLLLQKTRLGRHRRRSAERLEDDHAEAQQARGPGPRDQAVREADQSPRRARSLVRLSIRELEAR
jgi:hypothetical protein